MWPYLIGAALLLGSGFGAGWHVRTWKASADTAEVVDAMHRGVEAQRERADTAATTYEAQRAAREAQTRYIDREVIRVVQAPVYAADCFDADGLRIVAAALAGSAPDPGKPAAAVPDPAASR